MGNCVRTNLQGSPSVVRKQYNYQPAVEQVDTATAATVPTAPTVTNKQPDESDQQQQYEEDQSLRWQQQEALVQHIADREDLSNKEGTMFLEKAKSYTKLFNNGHINSMRSLKLRHSSSRSNTSPVNIKKSSSTSTIYTDDNTVSNPDLKHTLRCVSLAVFYHIKNRDRTRPPRTMDIFDEKLHPLTRDEVPSHYGDFTPDNKIIYRFIKTLFHAAQLTSECGIITLVYLERLLHYAELDLHPSNWKRILLGAILLASKVWDDQAVWNVDYCQILKDITVEDMNELERVFLEQLQFNINVLSSTYAKYYFDLRSLAEDNGLLFPTEHEALTKERARRLEVSNSNPRSFC